MLRSIATYDNLFAFLVFLEAKIFFVATLFMVPPLPKYFLKAGSQKKFLEFFRSPKTRGSLKNGPVVANTVVVVVNVVITNVVVYADIVVIAVTCYCCSLCCY